MLRKKKIYVVIWHSKFELLGICGMTYGRSKKSETNFNGVILILL